MRVGYFGPEGTFTHEALIAGTEGLALDQVPFPTIYDTVMALAGGAVDRALVPIENSLEGSVNATLDTLAIETKEVAIVGEVVHTICHCLVARTSLALAEIETVVSHPQATAQCARFIRTELAHARVLVGASTAEAVRVVAHHEGSWAALGTALAAERYGCQVVREGVEDGAANETRFIWLAPAGSPPGPPGYAPRPDDRWKTAVVFWGAGSEAAGWLVRCLAEFATREVNLTRIESRPLKRELGEYMFFADLEGSYRGGAVAEALAALGSRVSVLRVLGSYPVPGR